MKKKFPALFVTLALLLSLCACGGAPSEGFEKFSHAVPMQSLENTYDRAELADFDAMVRAMKAGGIEQLKSLLTGSTSASSSPITALAGQIFNANVLKKLNLGSTLNTALSGLIPTIMGKLSGILKDQDGDGDVDLNDILITLKGGAGRTASTGSLGGGLLGGILGKVIGGK